MARRWEPVSDEELERQIEEARQGSMITDESAPRAVSARYDRAMGRIEVELGDGWMFAFPVEATEGLNGARPEDLEEVEIAAGGYALHWQGLDVHYTVPGLLAGRLGSRIWMREHARRAGSATSEAKAKAARQNGLKGGRPRGSGKRHTSG
jgi:hypothetical protein